MAEEAPGSDRVGLVREGRVDPRALWTLLVGNGLTSMGVSFFLPILPLYLAFQGAGSLLIGLIFAAGITGRALVQYPAGWLSDRYGRRPLLVLGLLVYAAIFPVYLLSFPPLALVAVRFLHALAGGTVNITATALMADLTESEGRGRAFGWLRASDMAGVLLGPALGGLVAGFRLDAVFIGAALVCLLALPLMLRLPAPTPRRQSREEEPPVSSWRLLRLLLPIALLGAPVYWVFGTYDSVWSLYISSRGASPFLVGVSFAAYALPILLLGGLAGGLADRLGALRAGTLALLTYGLLAATYPFISSVPVLIVIGFLEGTLTAAGNPALMAEVSRRAPAGAQGRTQGIYGLLLNSAEVAGAVVGGGLYLRGPVYAFLGATTVCLAGVASSLAVRMSGWPSRFSEPEAAAPGGRPPSRRRPPGP